MVLAYLRGFLAPDYPMGVRSRVREELLLDVIAREQHSDNLDKMASYMATLAPPTAPREVLSKIQNLIRQSNILRGLKPLTDTGHANIDGLAAIYKVLLKSKLVEKIKSERSVQS